ncbi:MAG: PaaI family thioesterase [Ferrovibrio sp.]|uniref:PaaI family thioesterase n=1 Tax=Ferrovibrio sp. TaxID=1917215 RepID=UPI002625D967|nr:PaaI family thioesterase [Ferrovibrio sp.]MCW0233509.1 PaaI family thioesterase [Ferrovibrio sp.]
MKMTRAELAAFLDTEFPQMRAQQFRIEHWDGATLRLAMPIGEQNLRPGNTVSGPAMMTLADCAAYLLLLGLIGPVALAVTTNLNINFLRKPGLGELSAEADMLKLGKTLAIIEITLYSAGVDEPVAHAVMTYAIPPKG